MDDILNAQLLERVRAGDRDAAAQLMVSYGPLIRRRFRYRMGRAMRRLADSEDLWATVARRLDRLIINSSVSASNERELLALLFEIARNAVCDKARVLARLERVEDPDSDFAAMLKRRIERRERETPEGFDIELDSVLRSLADPRDRQILLLWLQGNEFSAAARELTMTPDAVRKRWQRIREFLRDDLVAKGVA